MDTVLVTGGAGYIGSHVVGILLNSGNIVRVLDNGMFGFQSLHPFGDNDHFELIKGDLRNISDIKRAVKGVHSIIHLGGIVGNPACSFDKLTCEDVNVTATLRLTELAAAAGVQRFIFASSCSVYGYGEQVFTEKSPLNPVDYYAESKIRGEEVLHDFMRDLTVTICRFATVFGASRRMRFDLAVNGMTASAVVEGICNVHGGSQWRPFIHSHDVATALCQIQRENKSSVASEIFNVGDDRQNMTLGMLGEKIRQAMPAVQVNIHDSMTDQRSYQVSFRKIHERLNFSGTIPLIKGIKEVSMLIESHIIPSYLLGIYSNLKTMEKQTA
ncbi:UNVERIFIED_ORG: nucleoside-diphosphate-sugar epimerase [Kosakonia oryzae]|uniref:Nucleoside-diphosphate-sugar epimerase n=1 Tax=Kosakonia radicincitans TaxID=283686 RepID=A0AAX2EVZ9_9ENTR|nr:NAD(P)-dependent oxidoreductase [Kosakonia radicincitans]MDP9568872.1 nucleoside-diphosphate-sugar epimerase [Kosakonia oryzae]SFF14200.1 Nucleoside-diphosphate-sugar epimerase [Kosakonia radicincitans]SFR21879.1 Nucleoside-diphosphate-sugar epimerase [Kosakonia radicincitans]SFT98222.1 Nucleoside-diphosphate-sugar epimerase [Kosakonia radicincitans]SFY13084.1 Nucleoside-diphosphate-sugar epimerase [Kosakonia radicincitans]